MKFVSETIIDNVIEELDNLTDDKYEKKMDAETAKLVNSILKKWNYNWSLTGHLLPKMYASALNSFNIASLIPSVTGMGYFMQEAVKIKRDVVIHSSAYTTEFYPELLPNYRG